MYVTKHSSFAQVNNYSTIVEHQLPLGRPVFNERNSEFKHKFKIYSLKTYKENKKINYFS